MLPILPMLADISVDFTTYLDKLTSSISTVDVLTVLGAVVGVGMGFFLMWLGVRKATTAFTSAVATGRIRI